jgi:hypothetical protein
MRAEIVEKLDELDKDRTEVQKIIYVKHLFSAEVVMRAIVLNKIISEKIIKSEEDLKQLEICMRTVALVKLEDKYGITNE